MFLNKNEKWVIEEIKEKNEKLLELNKNKNFAYQNLQDTMKSVLREKFIAMDDYIFKNI